MKTFLIIVALVIGLTLAGMMVSSFIGIYPYLDFDYLGHLFESGVVIIGVILLVTFLFAIIIGAVYLLRKTDKDKPSPNPVNIFSGEQASSKGEYFDYGDHRKLELGGITKEELTMLIAEAMQRKELLRNNRNEIENFK